MTLGDLYARVEAATQADDNSTDHLLPARICVGLCDLLQLTNSQRSGVEDARLFLAGLIDDQRRLAAGSQLSRGLDEFHHRGDGKSREEAIQRLAWATLVTTEPMSPVMGEFLVHVADRAGLSADEIAGVFDRLLPGFATTA